MMEERRELGWSDPKSGISATPGMIKIEDHNNNTELETDMIKIEDHSNNKEPETVSSLGFYCIIF